MLADFYPQLDASLIAAASRGAIDDVKQCLDDGATSLDKALMAAARNNHVAVINHLLDHGAPGINEAMAIAAGADHQEAVRAMLSRGPTNLRSAIIAAINGDHRVTLATLLDKTTPTPGQWVGLIEHAIKHNRVMIAATLIDQAPPLTPAELKSLMRAACAAGHDATAHLLVSKGAPDVFARLQIMPRPTIARRARTLLGRDDVIAPCMLLLACIAALYILAACSYFFIWQTYVGKLIPPSPYWTDHTMSALACCRAP